MARRWAALTGQQLLVLRWIAEGCPSGVMAGEGHKHSARALRDRGLVSISKRGGWSSVITEDGRYYLEHGGYRPALTHATRRLVEPEPVAQPRPAGQASPRFEIDAAELVARVQSESSKQLVLQNLSGERRAAYRRALSRAGSDGQVPDGFVLRHTGRDNGPLIIRLRPLANTSVATEVVDQSPSLWSDDDLRPARQWLHGIRQSGNVILLPPDTDLAPHHLMGAIATSGKLLEAGETISFDRTVWGPDRDLGTAVTMLRSYASLVQPSPVKMLEQVRRYSPTVSWFREQGPRHEVTKQALPRALLILESIAREVAARGWSLHPREVPNTPGYSHRVEYFAGGQFEMVISGHRYHLRIREQAGPGGARIEYQYPDQRPLWQQRRQTRFVPTGKLLIETPAGEFRDDSRHRLEQRLPDLFAALRAKVQSDDDQAAVTRRLQELRDAARQQLAKDRRVRWQTVRDLAEQQAIRAHRADVLNEQLLQFELTGRLDCYLTALESGADRERVDPGWVAWIRAYRDDIDPLRAALTIPTDPPITAERLLPFMQGLDPTNPDKP